MAITLRNTKGSALTHPELDGNFIDLDTRVHAVAQGGTGASTVADARTNLGVDRKNYIINGNFDIWQRGVSQTSNGYGSADRWYNVNDGSTKTSSRQAFVVGQTDVPNNPKYFSRTIVNSVAGAGNYVIKIQRMEDVTKLAGKTVTLSFWAKADSAKNIAIAFRQIFGTGGSVSEAVDVAGVTTIPLTTLWAKHVVTIDIPSVVGKTLGTNNDHFLAPHFWFDAGSDFNSRTNSLGQQSGTFDIAQVQLEEGSVATDFEYRPIGEELALCQRYYEEGVVRVVSYVTTTVMGHVQAHPMQPKRAVPTITILTTGSLINATGIGTDASSPQSLGFSCTGIETAPGVVRAYGTWSADAEL